MHSGKTRSVPGNLEGVDLPNTSLDCLDCLTEFNTLTAASNTPRKKAMDRRWTTSSFVLVSHNPRASSGCSGEMVPTFSNTLIFCTEPRTSPLPGTPHTLFHVGSLLPRTPSNPGTLALISLKLIQVWLPFKTGILPSPPSPWHK